MKKLILFFVAMLCFSSMGLAQTKDTDPGKRTSISLDLRDAPVRDVIESVFKQADIKNYVIDNNVFGFVTLKITEQTFENGLKLLMRASSVPLTYSKENDVWFVKLRQISVMNSNSVVVSEPKEVEPMAPKWEVITLNHIDAYDLQQVLGQFTRLELFTRFKKESSSGGRLGNSGFGSSGGSNNNGGR